MGEAGVDSWTRRARTQRQRRDAGLRESPALLLNIVLLAFCTACTTPDDTCLVGTLAGEPMTVASARAATAWMLPPPPRAEAIRLAVDIEVAHRARGGDANATPADKLQSYRAWTEDSGGKRSDWAGVAAQMRGAREAAGFEPGPCYPAAAPASREPL